MKKHRAEAAVSLGPRVLVGGFGLMRRFLWRGIAYVAVVELVTAVIFSPLITWTLYRILAASGEPVRLNFDLVELFLSPHVLLGLLWLPVLALIALLSVGGLVVLAAASQRGGWLSLRATFVRVLRCLPLVRGVAVIKAVLYFVVALPVLGAVASGLISGAFVSFPESALFEVIPFSTALAVAAALTVAVSTVVALWLTVRWQFVAFGVAVEGLTLGPAFRRSVELGRGQRWPLVRLVVGATLIVAVAYGVATALLGVLNGLVVRATAGMSEVTFTWIAALLITLDVALLSFVIWTTLAWLVAVTAAAYYRVRGDAGGEGPDWLDAESLSPSASMRLRTRLVIAVALLVAATAFTVPDVVQVVKGLHREVEITAHRGSALRTPENTVAAVRAAIEDEADYIEIDVQQASDGGIVLLHDLTLQRTSGRPEGAWQLTTEELTGIDAGVWFSVDFAGETIPTLVEVIEVVRGHALLNIEVKLHGHEEGLVRKLVTLLESEDFLDQCVVTSLDQAILADLRREAPTLRVGMIISASVGDVGALDVDLLAVQPLLATPEFIARAHRRGQEVHVWSLNEARNMNMVIDRGADGILTPDPALGRRVLESRTAADDVRALLLRLFGRAGRLAPAPAGWE